MARIADLPTPLHHALQEVRLALPLLVPEEAPQALLHRALRLDRQEDNNLLYDKDSQIYCIWLLNTSLYLRKKKYEHQKRCFASLFFRGRLSALLGTISRRCFYLFSR